MLAYGDIEAVNLSTGERSRRVAGNGESRLVATDESMSRLLEESRREVQTIIDRELAGERIPQGLMEFRMR